jgi:thiamine biosynthesis lipoprotein
MTVNVLTYFRYEFKAMGTPCDIQLYAQTEQKARQAAQIVIKDIERLEQRYSRYKTDSFLSDINRVAASGGDIEVDDETASLLDYALTCYEQSDGLFDITSGLLRQAWTFQAGKLPDPGIIESLLTRIGWHRVIWRKPMLAFSVPGMEIDFGGVVKEYAVDRAATLCLQHGIKHGVINLGGDIKVIGPRADGSPWRVGIRDPRSRDDILDTLLLYEGAMASSGDYERCIIVDGKRYGHVLNPKTGWPVGFLSAVSVIGDFCVVAGSASTIAMLKESDGVDWLEELSLPYLWVDIHGQSGGSLFNRQLNEIKN